MSQGGIDGGVESSPRGVRSVRCRACRPGAILPKRMTEGASGFDLAACLEEPRILEPSERAAIPTGLVMAIPRGLEGVVRPRSGLALRAGVTLLNAPGTIDSDYRGEVCVILVNLGAEPITISHGDRIAQLVIQELPPIELAWGAELDETERGAGGFGHTGLASEPTSGMQ